MRVHVVYALSKLQGTSDSEDGESDPIVARLLDMLPFVMRHSATCEPIG